MENGLQAQFAREPNSSIAFVHEVYLMSIRIVVRSAQQPKEAPIAQDP